MKKILLTLLIALIGGVSVVYASALTKTWSAGETLLASDLNANFSHIHDNMVGNHGARLVNADVSTSAAIAHSKLASPALVPKAFAAITTTTCAAGTCTMDASSGVTSVTWSATGVYIVTLNPARANAAYAPFATSHTSSIFCATTTIAAATYRVDCKTDAAVATNTPFSTFIMDNDN